MVSVLQSVLCHRCQCVTGNTAVAPPPVHSRLALQGACERPTWNTFGHLLRSRLMLYCSLLWLRTSTAPPEFT